MLILHNATLYTGDAILKNHSILIEGNTIHSIIEAKKLSLSAHDTLIDCEGKLISPGFIDLQINGFGGKLLNEEISRDTFQTLCKSARYYGATTIAPTLITTSDENMKSAILLYKTLEKEFQHDIVGLHIEGPYISLPKRGVHNATYVRTSDSAMINFLVEHARLIALITVAPEVISQDHLQQLLAAQIPVAIGHTNATYKECDAAIKQGVRLATHLYNAMSGFSGRSPGAIGAIFNAPLYAGIIADGFHCDYSSLEIAKKIKQEHLFLVTDAAKPAGTTLTEFVFEGTPAYHHNGKLTTKDGTLAGSVLTMIDAVKNCVTYTSISLEEALKMATLYPARAIKKEDQLGKIAPTYIANLLILSPELTIETVIHQGVVEPQGERNGATTS